MSHILTTPCALLVRRTRQATDMNFLCCARLNMPMVKYSSMADGSLANMDNAGVGDGLAGGGNSKTKLCPSDDVHRS